MKKILSFSLALMATAGAIAQPILNNYTTSPQPGDKFYSRSCVKTGVNKGVGGANVTWDFSGIEPITVDMDSVIYTNCASTTYCDSVPYATVATHTTSGWGYNFYYSDTNSFRVVSNFRPGESWRYSGEANVIAYPMTYGTRKVNAFFKNQPAFGNSVSATDSFIADGYGTLILPYGTYANVLRIRVLSDYSENTSAPGYPTSINYRKEEYRWYQPGIHSPLLVMTYDPNTASAPILRSVLYYTRSKGSTGVAQYSNTLNDVSVFPNPATNELNVKLSMTRGGTVTISATDMTGRIAGAAQQQYVAAGTTEIMYNTTALATGIYLIKVQTEAGTEVKKVQIIK